MISRSRNMHVALVVDEHMKEDRVFDISAGRDNVLERFCLLRKYLNKENIVCRTVDMFAIDSIDVLIFQDIMNNLNTLLKVIKANPYVKLIYVPNEPSFVIPFHDEKLLTQLPVDFVLTWNDRIAGKLPHIIKCNIGQPVIREDNIPLISFSEKKFICSIFAYKPSSIPSTLFNERIRIVDFFSQEKTGMDLYGVGWDSAKLPFIKSVYKGACDNKKQIQKNYKFSVAFENAENLPGLITEKIFDCFSAGTVPLYLGEKNIDSFIPSACFIDVRAFNDYKHLRDYLVSMTEERYQQYLNEAKVFIKSPEYKVFTSVHYAETVVSTIKKIENKAPVARAPFFLKLSLIWLLLNQPRALKNWRKYKRMFLAMLIVW